jgi:hypothetical protein
MKFFVCLASLFFVVRHSNTVTARFADSAQTPTFSSAELNAALSAAGGASAVCSTRSLQSTLTSNACSCVPSPLSEFCPTLDVRHLQLRSVGPLPLLLGRLSQLQTLDAYASTIPVLDLTGLHQLEAVSIASSIEVGQANDNALGELRGLEDVCRRGKLRSLQLAFVGLRELDLSACDQLETLVLVGMPNVVRFVPPANAPRLRVASISNVLDKVTNTSIEDTMRRALLPLPDLFYFQMDEFARPPGASVTDGWRGHVCRVNPAAPMLTQAGGVCNTGRMCFFNAGNCGPCGSVAESRCATGRFCPPPSVAKSKCTAGVAFDVAVELFNGRSAQSDDHVCIKFAQAVTPKFPDKGAACTIDRVDSNVKGVVALAGASFSSCMFRFSDDNSRIVSFSLQGSSKFEVRLGTPDFECGARFSAISLAGADSAPVVILAANTTTFAGPVVGSSVTGAQAGPQNMVAEQTIMSTTAPETDPLNRAAIVLAAVLVVALLLWTISCAVLLSRLRKLKAANDKEPEATATVAPARISRRRSRRSSSRRHQVYL